MQNSSLSDNQLMIKVREGEGDQLGILYDRYKNILFKFYFNLLHNAALSEDLVQNVFERIIKYKHRFRGDGQFKYWIFAIARNVHIDHFQKKGNAPKEDINDWSDRVGIQPSHMVSIEQKEEIQLLRKAIQKLDIDKREALVLSRLHYMKYKEIASILNISEGAVKVRIFRGLKELREIYTQLEKNS